MPRREQTWIKPKPCKGCGLIFTPPTFRQRYCADCRGACAVEGCQNAVKARGYCGMHLWRLTVHGDTGVAEQINKRQSGPCRVDGCAKQAHSKGYCDTHYWRVRAHGTPGAPETRVTKPTGIACEIAECSRPSIGNGLCRMHYERVRNTGDPGPATPYRRANGEGHLANGGYLYVTVDGRSIAEHRLVMAQIIGRPLLRHESPHHLNGQRADNRPSNLELWSKAQPAGQRVLDKLLFAKEMIVLYPDLARLLGLYVDQDVHEG